MTLTRPRTSTTKSEDLRLDVNRTRRRPWLAVASVTLIATSTAGFTSLYLKAGHQVGVLVVARPVAQGATITSNDVGIARLSFSPPLAPISASDIDHVMGHTAAVALVPGTLLTRADLLTASVPPGGESVVGVAAKPSQLPAGGVVPGESVDVILTGVPGTTDVAPLGTNSGTDPNSTSPGSPGTLLLANAVVSDVAAPPTSSGSDVSVVSLIVPSEQAGAVASASAAGQAALVVVSPRS
jgi:Flp pilus assembly protein CpaB